MPKKTAVFQLSERYDNGIRIPFNDIFGQNFGEEIEDFDLVTKRTYSNNVKFIIEENNKLIQYDTDHEIIANYLMVKHRIDKQRYPTPEAFIQSVLTEILKPWFVDRIGVYVREEYTRLCDDIDKSLHNNEGKLNPSLVFTNEHSIILYHIAVAFRFIIPLTTHFIHVYSDMISNQDPNELFCDPETGQQLYSLQDALVSGKKLFNKTNFLVSIVKEIIHIITDGNEDMNIYGKLNHYILSLIKGTGYSDAEMWSKLAMRATSKYNLADVIMSKILIDILPKATFKKSAIKFIVTTIEAHINWTLHQDFNIHYNMISPVSEDSDFSDADRFEINSVKVNELKKIINDNFMDDTINIIFARRGFVIDPSEYSYYLLNNTNIHDVQTFMIYGYFATPFGGWSNLDGLNKNQWTMLLVFMIHFLEDNKFKLLPKILTGTIVNLNEKRVLNRPIERKLKESIRYQRIMEKYKHTGDAVLNSGIIEQNTMIILNSKIAVNQFNNKHNGEIMELDTAEVCDEFLRFIELI